MEYKRLSIDSLAILSHVVEYYGYKPASKLLLLLLSYKSYTIAHDFPLVYTRLPDRHYTEFELTNQKDYYRALGRNVSATKKNDFWIVSTPILALHNFKNKSVIEFSRNIEDFFSIRTQLTDYRATDALMPEDSTEEIVLYGLFAKSLETPN